MEKQATLKEKFSIFSSWTVDRPGRSVSGDGDVRYGLSKAQFMEKVQQSNEACQHGDFQMAVQLYTNALQADPQNCILYSNRSAALLRLGQHQAAVDDAEKACELNPKWPKGVHAESQMTEGRPLVLEHQTGICYLTEEKKLTGHYPQFSSGL